MGLGCTKYIKGEQGPNLLLSGWRFPEGLCRHECKGNRPGWKRAGYHQPECKQATTQGIQHKIEEATSAKTRNQRTQAGI